MRLVGSFASFTTARLAIYASQQGLNLTGHNISNINTEGYTRQKLDQMALRTGSPDRFGFTHTAQPGNGVLLTGISQIRDPFLDIRFRNEQASVGFMDAKLSGLEDIARIMDEITRGDGSGILEAQFNTMFTQLENLSTRVGQEEFDTNVRSSAESLVALLNSYSQRLDTVYENQKDSFTQDLTRVNYLLQSIGDLNSSILRSDIHGDPGLELRDQRNLYIDELSQYIKIDVRYESVGIGLGETAENLVISLASTNRSDLSAAESVLLDGRFYTQFSITQDPGPGSPPVGTVDNPNFSLELSALTDSRGKLHDNPLFQTGVALGDNDLYGSLQASREILTEAGEFTDLDVLTDSSLLSYDPDANTKRGIPYYQKALDALALQFATVMNEINTGYMYNEGGVYVNALGQPLAEFVDGVNTYQLDKYMELTDDMRAFLADPANGAVKFGGPLFSNSSAGNDATGINAANISISKAWSIRDIQIVNSFQMGNGNWSVDNPARPGSTDTSNIQHMLVEFRGKQDYLSGDINSNAYDPNTPYFQGNFQEFLANINTTLATDMNSTTSLLRNYVSSANELNTSRDSVSGVDLNDETVSLMQYQKTYAAACRLMTTLDEALDKLINNMGLVGR